MLLYDVFFQQSYPMNSQMALEFLDCIQLILIVFVTCPHHICLLASFAAEKDSSLTSISNRNQISVSYAQTIDEMKVSYLVVISVFMISGRKTGVQSLSLVCKEPQQQYKTLMNQVRIICLLTFLLLTFGCFKFFIICSCQADMIQFDK